jgi:tetratricopeptide (TPR) repeat protein
MPKNRWKADALKHQEKFEEAIAAYKQALSNVPRDKHKQIRNQIADCLKDYGVYLNKQKKYHDSLMKFNEALETYVTEDYSQKYSLLWWKVSVF